MTKAYRRRWAIGVVAVVVVLLGGCGGSQIATVSTAARSPAPRPAPTTSSTTEPPLPTGPVQWSDCGALQCGTVTAPLDYATSRRCHHPDRRRPSPRRGSLGADRVSGHQSRVARGARGSTTSPNEISVLPPELLDRFDIVSFDPRGVERTSPVTCPGGPSPASGPPGRLSIRCPPRPSSRRSSATTAIRPPASRRADSPALCRHGRYRPRPGPDPGGRGRRRADLHRPLLRDAPWSHLCRALPDPRTGHGARRGDRPGTVHGGVRERPGRQLRVRTPGLLCLVRSHAGCAWRPSGDPTPALLALIAQSRTQPFPSTGGSTAGPDTIYDDPVGRPGIRVVVAVAGRCAGVGPGGDGSAAARMSGRYEHGGSSNGASAEQAIDCLDHPTDRNPSSYPALAARAARSAPVFGPLLAWGLLGCATWPAPPTRSPAPVSDPGAPPVLVVGTTGDPVTPYRWAVGLPVS